MRTPSATIAGVGVPTYGLRPRKVTAWTLCHPIFKIGIVVMPILLAVSLTLSLVMQDQVGLYSGISIGSSLVLVSMGWEWLSKVREAKYTNAQRKIRADMQDLREEMADQRNRMQGLQENLEYQRSVCDHHQEVGYFRVEPPH